MEKRINQKTNAQNNKMETKNFLLISLEENKSKKLAEVISNDSCRKILDYLSNKKDATETDISKELKIPISTVHYNLKALQEANLVIVDEFHYSKKGKEVNHYKLANKYIIIAPKNEEHSKITEALKKIMPFGIISLAVAGVMYLFNMFINAGTASMKSSSYVADANLRTMQEEIATAAGSALPTSTTEITRPLLQSNFAVYFLIGVLSVIIIYFIYELVKKR